jgi:DNA-binding MarR family transcriptional regulator
VSLTASGKALHKRVLKVALERERRLLSGLSASEVDTLIELLGRLHSQVANVNEYDPADA